MSELEMILEADMAFEEMWWEEHPEATGLYRDQHHDEIVQEKKKFIRGYLCEAERYERERIEELEERQHLSGFYAFQDMMEMRRFER